METLVAFVLGWAVSWWYTPEPIPHVIDYKPKTELIQPYKPNICKEEDGLSCVTGFPRIVTPLGSHIEFKDRYIDTKSELKQCIIKINNHNANPMSYKKKELW